MRKRPTKKRDRRNKGKTQRYRFRGGADCTQALETCDRLVKSVEPLAAEVRKLHRHLKENAKSADDGDDNDPLDEENKNKKEAAAAGEEEGAESTASQEEEGSVRDEHVTEATANRDVVGEGEEGDEDPGEQQKEGTTKATDEGHGGVGSSGGGWLEGFFAGGGRRKRRGREKTRAIRRPMKRKSRRRK